MTGESKSMVDPIKGLLLNGIVKGEDFERCWGLGEWLKREFISEYAPSMPTKAGFTLIPRSSRGYRVAFPLADPTPNEVITSLLGRVWYTQIKLVT